MARSKPEGCGTNIRFVSFTGMSSFSLSVWMIESSWVPPMTRFLMSSKNLWIVGLQIEDQGHPVDCIGVNIKQLLDGLYKFSQ
ncbi:hypothetical protein ACHAW6_002180 [Cyclotella cf. meneghiniana]